LEFFLSGVYAPLLKIELILRKLNRSFETPKKIVLWAFSLLPRINPDFH